MKLNALLAQIEPLLVEGSTDLEIAALCYDSRKATKGALFFALPGARADGREYIPQAVLRGAEAVASESGFPRSGATSIVVASARQAMADLAAAFYEHPARALKIAGVTGTNGKTTTTFLLKHLCEQALLRCGMMGTVRYEIGDRVEPASRTTPESLDIHHLLWQMRSAGCKAAAMEVSSHALVQERVRGIEFDVAIFTNLTQDHLDYHGSMEDYYEAKLRLFTGLAAQRQKKGKAVINIDDRYGGRMIARLGQEVPVITYGLGARADFRASNTRVDFHGTSYQLDARNRSYLVRLPLTGMFNVYNSLAAIAGAFALGVDVRSSVLALAGAPSVPGRLEPVPGQRSFKVYVDYAHTDDALLNVLKTLRALDPERLIVVFGCGGNRDRGKRPRMGAVVDQYSDFAIVTSDNPRKEDPAAIVEDIKPGLQRGAYEVLLDRRDAIFRAIDMAQPRDIILIAGKGHETYQEFADQTLPFSDVAVALAALEGKRMELPS